MRHLTVILASLLLLVAVTVASFYQTPDRSGMAEANSSSVRDPLIPPLSMDLGQNPFNHDQEALPHAHGENLCASGCALSRHPTVTLSADGFRHLLTAYQQAAPTAENPAFEKLLFYGRQSRQHWEKFCPSDVDPLWQTLLERELNKTHVDVSLRILDESGNVRSKLTHVRVPLDRRHVFAMQSDRLQPLITSGTVKRVGLDHLWTRL